MKKVFVISLVFFIISTLIWIILVAFFIQECSTSSNTAQSYGIAIAVFLSISIVSIIAVLVTYPSYSSSKEKIPWTDAL